MAKKGLANTPAQRSQPHVVENAYRKLHGRNVIANPADVPAPVVSNLDTLTRDELRDEAEKRGLSKSGTKSDLIERIKG